MGIGNRIKQLRKEKGLSQEDFGNQLGVSRQAISKWELEEATPDTDNLVALSDYFNVSLEFLLRNQQVTQQEKIIVREVQPIVSSGCLKKGLLLVIAFVIGWFLLVLVCYQFLFV